MRWEIQYIFSCQQEIQMIPPWQSMFCPMWISLRAMCWMTRHMEPMRYWIISSGRTVSIQSRQNQMLLIPGDVIGRFIKKDILLNAFFKNWSGFEKWQQDTISVMTLFGVCLSCSYCYFVKMIQSLGFFKQGLMLISLGHDFFSSKKTATQQTNLSSVSSLGR